MKNIKHLSFNKWCILGFSLIGIPLSSFASEVNPGLFQLNLSVNFISNQTEKITDPICYAITNRKTIEIDLEWKETKGDDKQAKIITKRVRIDPYLFGRNLTGQVILRGNVSSEKTLSEISVKSDNKSEESSKKEEEDKNNGGSNLSILRGQAPPKVIEAPKSAENKKIASAKQEDKNAIALTGVFQSVFKGDAVADTDPVAITKISGFVVIENSNFVVVKDQKDAFNKDVADTICSVE